MAICPSVCNVYASICVCGTHTCRQAYISVSFLFIYRVACTIHIRRSQLHIEIVYILTEVALQFNFFQWLRAKWMNAFSLCACRVCVAVIYSLAFRLSPNTRVIISLGAFSVHTHNVCICQRNHKQIPKTTATANCKLQLASLFTAHCNLQHTNEAI